MRQGYMTDDELRARWKNRGLSTRHMLQCLADLNAVSPSVMRERLEGLGIDVTVKSERRRGFCSATWKSEETAELVRMHREGKKLYAIASALHRTRYAVESKIHLLREAGTI